MREHRTARIVRLSLVAAALAAVASLGVELVAVAAGAEPEAAPQPAAEATAPKYSRKGADTCIGCHGEEELLGLFRTKHAAPKDARSPFGPGQLQCEACHGPGDAHARGKGKNRPDMISFGRGAATPVEKQNAMCLGCHKGNVHGFATSQHAAAEVGCADCHDSHEAHDRVQAKATQAEVCTTCHAVQHSNLSKPSRHPVLEGKMSCTSCHAPHGSSGPSQLVKASVTETCTSCHADLRGPFLWEHQPVAEDCGNCHDPHGSIHPAMLKARGPFLCQTCHQAAGHPSAPFGPENTVPGGRPSAYVVNGNCANCHQQVHGSNHPSGRALMR